MKHRQHSQKDANAPGAQGGFRLPPDVSFNKQQLPHATAYVFRHRLLGELGRIVLEETSDGSTRLSFEVVGDPADPMTAERAAIFEPLGMELARQMKAATGPTADAGPSGPPPRPPEPKEVIESRLIPCKRCGHVVAMLIFAPQATDAGGFEDYARKMYPEYSRLNLPTWIIGPALGGGPLIDRKLSAIVPDCSRKSGTIAESLQLAQTTTIVTNEQPMQEALTATGLTVQRFWLPDRQEPSWFGN